MTLNDFVQPFRTRQGTQTFILPLSNLHFKRDFSLLTSIGFFNCCFSPTVQDSFPEDFGVDTTT